MNARLSEEQQDDDANVSRSWDKDKVDYQEYDDPRKSRGWDKDKDKKKEDAESA